MDFSEILIKHEEEIKKAIKTEYPQGQTIYFNYDDKITENDVNKALENSKDHGSFLNALKDNIDEEMWESRDDLKNELGNFVANLYHITLVTAEGSNVLIFNPEEGIEKAKELKSMIEILAEIS